jgi:hypothetical protein
LVLVAILKVGSRAEIYQRIRESDVNFLRSLLQADLKRKMEGPHSGGQIPS